MSTIPTATYRIQFTPSFGFSQAYGIVEYLKRLGISHLYASPVFHARSGSTHGYDVVDPCSLNPELGTRDDFDRLARQVHSHGMGWLQDIVPNHMAFSHENHMLMDVLENGSASRYYSFFDIQWNHVYQSLRGKVLAPFLGSFYAACLESGEIRLVRDEDGLAVRYYDHRFPLGLHSYSTVFRHHLDRFIETQGENSPETMKLIGLLHFFEGMHEITEPDARMAQASHAKRMLRETCEDSETICKYIDSVVDSFNGSVGNSSSFNLLDTLLSDQLFRLAFWKVASEEINYRRFFTINDLICLRVEDQSVFEQTHALIFDMVDQGVFQGIRVDHIDGLYDPTRYFQQIRQRYPDLYMVAEKILAPNEELPSYWPIHGTTGYDFLNDLNGVFCKRENSSEFAKIYFKTTGQYHPFEKIAIDKKRLILGKHLAGNVDILAHLMKNLASKERYGRDITLYGLRRALVEVLAHFPVYRTYIDSNSFGGADRDYLTRAISSAKAGFPALEYELQFIEDFFLVYPRDEMLSEEERQLLYHFIMEFQQLTGPLTAKGVEDTTFYVYNKFISLNDVGGDPSRFGLTLSEFHDRNTLRKERTPASQNATATHDTKRGEDVRARLNVLSEIPREWRQKAQLWSRMNRARKRHYEGSAPDANDEYFLYQTLIGTFPFEPVDYADYSERIVAYMIKAVREAKVHTAWIKNDTEYEEACTSFVQELLKPTDENRFLEDFVPFQRSIAFFGMLNSLSQLVLKMTSPGIPDFYQGNELWDFSLVDPDNRRAVDFGLRSSLLDSIDTDLARDLPGTLHNLMESYQDGRIKLFLTMKGLELRQKMPEIFEKGEYVPLSCEGAMSDTVVSFLRRLDTQQILVIVPRFLTDLVSEGDFPLGEEIWRDTAVVLPGSEGRWRNWITGEELRADNRLAVGSALNMFPAGIFTLLT